MQPITRNLTSIELGEIRDSSDSMFSLLQGLPGFVGPVGETGIAGEKVSMVSICHPLLVSQFVVVQRPFYSVIFLGVFCF